MKNIPVNQLLLPLAKVQEQSPINKTLLKLIKPKLIKWTLCYLQIWLNLFVNEHKNHKIPAILWITPQKQYAPKTTVRRMRVSFINVKLNSDKAIPDYLVCLTNLNDQII